MHSIGWSEGLEVADGSKSRNLDWIGAGDSQAQSIETHG